MMGIVSVFFSALFLNIYTVLRRLMLSASIEARAIFLV